MKKQTWIEILVIAALAAGWFYMEKTESLTIFVKEDMTKEELAKELLNYVLDVASGRKVKSEEAGFHDMAIFKQGVTL